MRYLKRHAVPGDYRTVEQRLELDDTDPDDSRYYAVMVAGAWALLAFVILVATLPIGYLVGSLGGQTDHIFVSVSAALCFFCLAGCANALWHVGWYVPQARRRLQDHGAGSEAFRMSMRRTLPGNTSLVFQTSVSILVLVLKL